MKKVLIRLFVVFCLTLSILIVAPFHIVSANNIYVENFGTSNVIGVTAFYNNTGSSFLNTINVVFDDHYVGKASFTFKYKMGSSTSFTTTTVTLPFNGTSAIYTFSSSSQSINSSSVSVTSISASGSIYRYSDFVNTFPVESLNFVAEMGGKGYEIMDLISINQYKYPVFQVPHEEEVTHVFLSGDSTNPLSEFTCIFWCNKPAYNLDSFYDYFTLSSGATLSSIEVLTSFNYGGSGSRMIKVVISNSKTTNNTVYLYTEYDTLVMPLFCRRNGEISNITKDFADLFKLPYNDGTNEQLQSASDLQDEQSEFSSSASDLYTYENNFNDSLNDSLDDINVNFDIGNTFGSKFLASASWVRQQFDALTSTSPFGSVLSFSLVLGIALLVIGKATK